MEIADMLKTQETARSLVYRRLADAFCEPSPALAAVLEEMQAALEILGSGACEDAARLKLVFGSVDIRTLKVDYTALFLGPFLVPAPPYGSVYLEDERRLMGDSTIEAHRQYLSFGLDLSPDFKDAPDHICAELEFMHLLAGEALEAVDAADAKRLEERVRRQHSFLQNHLGAWVPTFAAKAAEHSGTDFYRGLALLTAAFIAEDLEALTDLPAGQRAAAEASA
ncbi:MAG: molecular chaperone TorD family protein [Desulfobacterales bacterium]|nr:molecular chaperone TorD family protein [Desulfobacterales bacterium]